MSLTDTPVARGDDDVARRRRWKGYQPYTVRPATKREATSEEVPQLFGDLFGNRPPLRPTSTAEVRARAGSTGLTCLSTFTGSGGGAAGFLSAGWDVVGTVEFVRSAAETYAANFPVAWVDATAVRDLVRADPDGDLVPLGPARKAKKIVHEAALDWETALERLVGADDATHERFRALRSRATRTAVAQARAAAPGLPVMWNEDIRGMDAAELLGGDVELDCLMAGVPCKSYSQAGSREDLWGARGRYSDERRQRTSDLLGEFLRTLRATRPRSFLLENVEGLSVGISAAEHLRPLVDDLTAFGYRVEARVLDSSDYGVPQVRRRTFVMGVRADLVDAAGAAVLPRWPRPSSWKYTVADVLEAAGPQSDLELAHAWLGSRAELRERLGGRPVPEEVEQGWPTTWRDPRDGTRRPVTDDDARYETGRLWHHLPVGRRPEFRAFQLERSAPGLPVGTIAQTSTQIVGSAGPAHPFEPRKFTNSEYRWFFGFPHDYRLTGTYAQQGERLGRSLPVPMAEALAGELAAALLSSRKQPEA